MKNTYIAAMPNNEQKNVITICNALDMLKAAGITIQQFSKNTDIRASALYQMRYSHRGSAALCNKVLAVLQQEYPQ